MQKIHYRTNDNELGTTISINMENQVWAGNYHQQYTKKELKKTINTTAWDNEKLVGCVRVLTDGYFFGTITEILVLPECQKQGIGEKLMSLAF